MGDFKLGRLVAARFKTSPFWWALRDSDLSRSGKVLPSIFLGSSVILAFLTLIRILEKWLTWSLNRE